jgi:hypothetical protein
VNRGMAVSESEQRGDDVENRQRIIEGQDAFDSIYTFHKDL